MTTSRTDEPITGTPPVAADSPDDDGARTSPAARRGLGAALGLLAALPAILGLVALWLDRDEPYFPFGDQAILALSVDAVGEHDVLLGAYSRFGWYHPGPMATYLLAGVYRVLGGATQAMAVGTLVIAGLATAVAVWLVHRRAGALPALWTVLVLALSVRMLGAGFLYDSWNPLLPVLPFLAGVLLCWTAILGNSWALPLAVVPMSLALQAHIGYLPAVGAVGAVLVLGLLLRAVRRLRRRNRPVPDGADRPRRALRWLVAVVAALALAALLWTPPLVQQVTGSPGNLGELAEYLLEGSPEDPAGLGTGLRGVADEFGKIPAYLVGAGSPDEPLLPEAWPPVAIAVGLAMFVLALADGVRRRREDVVWLGVLTLAVAAAGVAAIARIDGFTYTYLTRWTVVVGILAWTTVGVSLMPELRAVARRWAGPRRGDALLAVPLAVLATAAVLVTGLGTARATPPMTDVTGQIGRLEEAVLADLDQRGLRAGTDEPVVRVDFPGTTRPDDLVGTFWPGTGLVLELHRDGVDVQVSPFWRMPFGDRFTDRADDAGYVVTLAYSDGSSPPPEPWQQILLVDGELQVYGGVPPSP
ncbi:hypothetical protein [Blastococcus goldschmidtiae]|uniref:4-amino-4-deoxy-L-arabinose transferase n=1 Tax=Blastococcus goldschmidtiae TaxID=3075546 RepID=A0ABU2KA76_9ACTN|nr:hypothetical protein [Blastococcus sp. DSM 46792]MDT0277087.1 hypothetical protein [Blastococcus sp. DSM 46792]